MGSFAEACTDDIVPFIKTWMAACIPIRELFPKPVRGSPNPRDQYKRSRGNGQEGGGCRAYLTFHGVPEAHVGAAVHGPGVILAEAEREGHVCRGGQPLHHGAVVVPRVATQGPFLPGVA